MRETIKLSDYLEENRPVSDLYDGNYPNDPFILISEDQNSYDAEKNFVIYDTVIQRKEDKKFFSFTYTQYNYSGDDSYEQEATEVFPQTKTVTYYV